MMHKRKSDYDDIPKQGKRNRNCKYVNSCKFSTCKGCNPVRISLRSLR